MEEDFFFLYIRTIEIKKVSLFVEVDIIVLKVGLLASTLTYIFFKKWIYLVLGFATVIHTAVYCPVAKGNVYLHANI